MLVRTLLSLLLTTPTAPVPLVRTPVPGVTFRTFTIATPRGPASGAMLEVAAARVGPLRPAAVAARRTVSAMVTATGALAGVNGDFFDTGAGRREPPPTGSAGGPEIDAGRPRKAAVPVGQRFGPPLPHGGDGTTAIGVDTRGRGRVAPVRLAGAVTAGRRRIPVVGLNQYALPVGGVGVYTPAWGTASRARAVCGTDVRRDAPCSRDVAEVSGRGGVVAGRGGSGGVPRDGVVLVGRERGAAAVRGLRPGRRVSVRYRAAGPVRFRFAVGGLPILRAGGPVPGLGRKAHHPRTAAGVSRNGRRMFLVVVNGRSRHDAGLSLAGLAALLRYFGAADAVSLDGGGSSVLVTRFPDEAGATVRTVPSDGRERAVANGLGVF
ncbi:phosphodiester glycosidase family protein [Actinomadura kijaniata]|uniref:phosphodiester glycosidase family protein n=1 Tax=Actinomadura kijaniata TaxID=46161 RepID=UPI0031CFDDD6